MNFSVYCLEKYDGILRKRWSLAPRSKRTHSESAQLQQQRFCNTARPGDYLLLGSVLFFFKGKSAAALEGTVAARKEKEAFTVLWQQVFAELLHIFCDVEDVENMPIPEQLELLVACPDDCAQQAGLTGEQWQEMRLGARGFLLLYRQLESAWSAHLLELLLFSRRYGIIIQHLLARRCSEKFASLLVRAGQYAEEQTETAVERFLEKYGA